jgi:8-oxo-dGTP diphosphatase
MTIQEPPKHSVSVSAAIVDEYGRFLVIRRADNGRWEPPGGVLELGESIEDGLIREVAEETGFTVEPLAMTGVYKNMTLGVVALVFRCNVLGRATRSLTDEVDKIEWLTGAQLSCMSDAYRVRLLDSVERRGAPYPRPRRRGPDVVPAAHYDQDLDDIC